MSKNKQNYIIEKPRDNSGEITDETKEYKLRAFFKKSTVHNLIFNNRGNKTVKEFENELIDELITWEWYTPRVSYKMIQSAITKVNTSKSAKIEESGDEIKEFIKDNYGVKSTWNSDKEYELRKLKKRNSHNPSYKGRKDVL